MDLSKTFCQEKGLISVLMGIYNCAATLPEAIDSVLKQTYSNWQLIMCDDGSTDNTYEVAKQYEEAYPNKIIVLRNDRNMRLQYTLNRCLQYAQGEYVARMDGDDVCSPERFEKEISFLNCNPDYALVSCQMEMFDEDGTFRTVYYFEKPYSEQLLHGSQFCHAGCMMRTDVLRTLNGYDTSEKCERVEDYDLWVRLYAAGYKGYNIQEVLYSMRDDRNAFVRRSLRNRLNESRIIFRAGLCFGRPAKGFFLCLVPIAKWFVPAKLYRIIHRKG